MAGCVTHLNIAQKLLSRSNEHSAWGVGREHQAWFLLGANAPDGGVYPGGHRILSDFSHYITPADLVRTMFELAETSQQRSFSLGWLTHVVADSIIHPLVNREVGRRLGLAREASYFQDPAMHLKVELGFDADVYDVLRLPYPRLSQQKLATISAFLHRAYCTAYRCQFDVESFNASLSALNRYATWAIALCRLNRCSHRSSVSLSKCVLVTLGALSPLAGIGNEAKAFFQTIAPSATFEREMWEGIERTIQECQEHLRCNLEQLENHNLDTGELCSCDESYPPAIQAKLRLTEYRTRLAPLGPQHFVG